MAGTQGPRPFDMTSLLGQRIRGLTRVFFEYAGVLERDDGPLECMCERTTCLLDSQSDGEQLRVREGPWVDPFEYPLTDENRKYVDEYGKWRRVDCSKDPPYADLIGQRIVAIAMLQNSTGVIAGVRLSTPVRELWFVVQSDECYVCWSHPGDVYLGETRADTVP